MSENFIDFSLKKIETLLKSMIESLKALILMSLMQVNQAHRTFFSFLA